MPTDTPMLTAAPTALPTPVPPGMSLSPQDLNFGFVQVGTMASLPVTVTNGGPSTLTPNFAGGAPGDPAAFDGSQNCAGVPLSPMQTCEFTYTFEPPSAGWFTSSTTIAIDDADYQITFVGCGITGAAIPLECHALIEQ